MGPIREDAAGEKKDPARESFAPANALEAAASRAVENRDEARTAAGLLAAASSRSPFVLGLALCRRSSEDCISLWLADASNAEAVACTRDLMCSLVRAPGSVSVEWRPHSKH